ncbi:MAG: hypothetical protein ACYCO9_18610 [Streptosporangiaceae bacterium]
MSSSGSAASSSASKHRQEARGAGGSVSTWSVVVNAVCESLDLDHLDVPLHLGTA